MSDFGDKGFVYFESLGFDVFVGDDVLGIFTDF